MVGHRPDGNASTVGSGRTGPWLGRSGKDVGEQLGRARAGDLGRGRRPGRRPDDQVGLGHIQPGIEQAGDHAAKRCKSHRSTGGSGRIEASMWSPRSGTASHHSREKPPRDSTDQRLRPRGGRHRLRLDRRRGPGRLRHQRVPADRRPRHRARWSPTRRSPAAPRDRWRGPTRCSPPRGRPACWPSSTRSAAPRPSAAPSSRACWPR